MTQSICVTEFCTPFLAVLISATCLTFPTILLGCVVPESPVLLVVSYVVSSVYLFRYFRAYDSIHSLVFHLYSFTTLGSSVSSDCTAFFYLIWYMFQDADRLPLILSPV